jgi:hypothetical protein
VEYDIKRGHFKKIDGKQLPELMKQYFGDVEKDGDKLVSNFGAMKPITVWIKDKKTICVEITTSKDVDDSTALETIKARNRFLLDVTGFSSKERQKRLKKKAKDGKL